MIRMMRKDLKIGDMVDLELESRTTATVIKVEDEWVTLIRPYVLLGDTIYSDGVGWSIGVETFQLFRNEQFTKVIYRETKEFK